MKKAADGDMKSLELAARYQEQLEAHDFLFDRYRY